MAKRLVRAKYKIKAPKIPYLRGRTHLTFQRGSVRSLSFPVPHRTTLGLDGRNEPQVRS